MAYQIPEYTAYSSMLSCFRRMVPVPMSLAAGDRYKLHVEELRKNVKWALGHRTRSPAIGIFE